MPNDPNNYSRLFDLMRGDLQRGRAGLLGTTKVAFSSAGGRLNAAVAADAARKIVDPVKVQQTMAQRRMSAAATHTRRMSLSPTGSAYRAQNATGKLRIGAQAQLSGTANANAIGQQVPVLRGAGIQRAREMAPGLARANPSLGVAAPAGAAAPAAAAASAPSSAFLAQQQAQAQAAANQVKAVQTAQKNERRQGALQIVNGDVEAANRRAKELQEKANKANQTAQNMQQQAQTAPGAQGAPAPAAPSSSFLGMELSPVARQRAMWAGGAVGAVGIGYAANRLMNSNNNNNQGQY